jgi:hypothetical protein
MTAESERAATFGRDEVGELSSAFTRQLTEVTTGCGSFIGSYFLWGLCPETRLWDELGSSALNLPCMILSP